MRVSCRRTKTCRHRSGSSSTRLSGSKRTSGAVWARSNRPPTSGRSPSDPEPMRPPRPNHIDSDPDRRRKGVLPDTSPRLRCSGIAGIFDSDQSAAQTLCPPAKRPDSECEVLDGQRILAAHVFIEGPRFPQSAPFLHPNLPSSPHHTSHPAFLQIPDRKSTRLNSSHAD